MHYTQLIIFAYSPFTVNENGTRQFKNMRAVLKHTAETEGIRGLYRGVVISCAGISAYHCVQFGLFTSLGSLMSNEKFRWVSQTICDFEIQNQITIITLLLFFKLQRKILQIVPFTISTSWSDYIHYNVNNLSI